jgi:hypothetical protein
MVAGLHSPYRRKCRHGDAGGVIRQFFCLFSFAPFALFLQVAFSYFLDSPFLPSRIPKNADTEIHSPWMTDENRQGILMCK